MLQGSGPQGAREAADRIAGSQHYGTMQQPPGCVRYARLEVLHVIVSQCGKVAEKTMWFTRLKPAPFGTRFS